MRKGTIWFVVCALILASVILASCGPGVPEEGERAVTIAMAAEPSEWDVQKAAAGVDWYFCEQVFELPLDVNQKLERYNGLFESWELRYENNLPVIDVTLRKGVTFTNGEPLTTDDLIFSWERQKRVSRWAQYVTVVDKIVAQDDYRATIYFKQKDGTFIWPGAMRIWMVPKDYVTQVGDEGFARNPIGTGPYRLVERKLKEYWVIEPYKDYWNKDYRPKNVDKVTVKIIPEDITRVAALKTKEVAWIDAVPPAMLAEVKAISGVKVITLEDANNIFIQLNAIDPKSPFVNEKVRKAVAYAIDKEAIVKNILFGQGIIYAGTTKGCEGYDPNLKPYPYDPEKAKQLLAEAGYPAGFDITFYGLATPRVPYMKEVGEALAAYLTKVGIRCNVVMEEYGAWINRGRRVSPPDMPTMIHWMWGHGIPPGDLNAPLSGHVHKYVEGTGWGSYSYHDDPELNKLVEEQMAEMDPAKRNEMIKNILRIKHERVAGGVELYRPLVSFAMWDDKVKWTPWPSTGWESLRLLELKR